MMIWINISSEFCINIVAQTIEKGKKAQQEGTSFWVTIGRIVGLSDARHAELDVRYLQ